MSKSDTVPVTNEASRNPVEVAPVTAESGQARDSAKTLQNILDVATLEFESKGFNGARIDAIAEATQIGRAHV